MTAEPSAPESPIRVGLADDDAFVRRALSVLLAAAPGIHVAWVATDGREALESINQQEPVDVVLLDMQMPNVDGLQVLEELSKAAEATRPVVVMLTTFGSTESVVEALKHGARGYFVKDDDPVLIAAGLRSAVAGAFAFSPTASKAFVEALQHLAPAGEPTDKGQTQMPGLPVAGQTNLTGREEEVLRLMAQSLSNKQIARRLSISEATVKTHVSVVISKLGVPDRVGAAVWAYQHGLA